MREKHPPADGLTPMGGLPLDALLAEHPQLATRIAANDAAREAGEGHWVYKPGKGPYWHGPLSAAQQAERAKEARHQALSRLRLAGIPGNFVEANFETNSRGDTLRVVEKGGVYQFGTRKAHVACRSLAEKWTPQYRSPQGFSGVILQSDGFGLGKTYLLSALMVRLTERGQRVRFVKCEDLLSLYRASFGGGGAGQSAEQIFEEYAAAPFLILDELGGDHIKSGEAGEWARTQLLRLLDRRLDMGRTAAGSTNLTQIGLVAHYGGRMVSRLLAGSVLIPMDGPDFRQVDAGGERFSDADDPFAD